MINRLRGKLIEKQPPFLLLEMANAFTYEVQASMHTFYQLPELGQEVMLYTQFIVREDGHYLYGFSDAQERALFSQLLKVNNVGPKVALGILSKIESSELIACVEQQDIATLQRVPGIGRKTAERLVIEMRDRLSALVNNESQKSIATMGDKTDMSRQYQQDAISALIALGYKPQEANRAVLKIKADHSSVEMLIRSALKNMDTH
ncbi:holliday junction ATP-dependent DNA helicase RuvA [Candidatus Rickettsiella viridis]|uniref:Holliday junction branch migration complex subunit RuvA n=1 Tax=Candidatus Rickettsiella viridis TaxID=676208 RepID=A0A2Z5UUY1_9COXI|nr:Holliday junction branch migration protein RuvA [Candidatus Rickettsiella viridis]BBB15294.1 holliday junction ATP-dependent DNA helicase RuvA [Candidatus Rickettsiella viridis]